MRSSLLAALAIGSMFLVACGSGDSSGSTSDAAIATTAAAPADGSDESDGESDAVSDASAVVSVSATDVGDVLVDAGGFTLYGFTTDSDGVPTCLDGCASAWPLYFYAGDTAPGDVNGQASGDVWFVAAPDGSLVGADEQTDATVDLGYGARFSNGREPKPPLDPYGVM